MLGRVSGVLYPPFFRRLDRWLLLRTPMLWRTRLFHCLLVLCFLTLTNLPIMRTNIDHPREVSLQSEILESWRFRVWGVAIALALWVRVILRKPVGELALHRHIVTVVAITIGSYLWLVTPSFLAYLEIRAIAGVQLGDPELNADLGFLTRYRDWRCIPPGVWKSKDEFERELKQLYDVLARYGYTAKLKTESSASYFTCDEGDSRQVARESLYTPRQRIKVIQDARSFWSDDSSENQFSGIQASFAWFLTIALGIGVLTTIFSYPSYVWRRTFLRR
jgi:hypothetical protein